MRKRRRHLPPVRPIYQGRPESAEALEDVSGMEQHRQQLMVPEKKPYDGKPIWMLVQLENLDSKMLVRALIEYKQDNPV